MEGFCRSCLIKFDEPTDLIPYSEKNRRLFVYATGLQVKKNDTFTFQLCKECYLNMKVACNFKKICKNSDKKYKNYLSNKEAGDNVDFCIFLKNNDESLKFRLPLYPGNSTPGNRNKDDDNESTCTSIQNFMTDILQADEIPDSEARIIKEVIEEEADILEDSLDSHWLQDDVSIDTDFRMDFSFSPFSTPRSTIGDNCYTPKKLNDLVKVQEENIEAIKVEHNKENYVINNFDNNAAITQKYETIRDQNVKEVVKCTIDINLENALKKESAKKVMLDELLATPPVIPNMSGTSTPLIKSILFGDKIEIDTETRRKNVYAPTDIIKDDEMDVLYEFFKTKNEDGNKVNRGYREDYMYEAENDGTLNKVDNNTKETDDKVKETVMEPQSPVENKYCLKTFYCKSCERQFKSLVALKVHCMKSHKIKIESIQKKRVRKQMICDYCGKMFTSSKCIVKHIENHMKPYQYDCEHCPLSFRTEAGVRAHKVTHGVFYQGAKTTRLKKYICNICGSTQTSSSNYHIHMRRHSNKYTKSCDICGKGFYRTYDLDAHMRRHTGERPFECVYCPSTFARQDTLNRHIKCHTGEKPFICIFCDGKFINGHELRNHQSKSKSCIEKQMVVVVKTANLNTENDVIVHYANVSDNGLTNLEKL